ncbi:hypothetical protein QEN19_003706 [Hanseniaspora menglaensis]
MNFLSISSHVVHGYVGNKTINVAIQYKPDVENIDIINTVQLNVHPKFIGNDNKIVSIAASKYDPKIIVNEIISKSLKNFLNCEYDCLIISYFNSNIGIDLLSDNLHMFEKSVKILDPIMGDNGKIYCNPLLVKSYQKMIKNNFIDCLLPNQFELELLTDSSAVSETRKDSIYYKSLIKKFHLKYPKVKNLVVTSVELGVNDNYILISDGMRMKKIKLQNYYEDTIIYGCGDLFTGLFAYEFTKTKNSKDIFDIVSAVLLSVQLIINKSIEQRINLENVESSNKENYKFQLNGLDLVNCIDSILSKDSAELIEEHQDVFGSQYHTVTL